MQYLYANVKACIENEITMHITVLEQNVSKFSVKIKLCELTASRIIRTI